MDKISKKKPKITVNEACQNRNESSGHLDKNSTWYKTVTQGSLDGFLLIRHPKGDMLDVNDAFCNMLGYSRNELISMNIKEIEVDLDEKKARSVRKVSAGIKESGKALFETRHRCKNGRIIDVSVSLNYLDKGLLACFCKDITEQNKLRNKFKQAEAALKESEDRHRTLIELGDKIGEAVIMLHDTNEKEGVHTYVSNQWTQITGYSREELLDMPFFDLVKPEDRQLSIKRHRQKMAGKNIPDLFEFTIIHKNGKEVPIEITSAVISYRGNKTNIVYVRDITARKYVEKELEHEKENYKSIFDNIPVAAVEMDYSNSKRLLDELKAQGITDFDTYFDEHPEAIFKFQNKQKIVSTNKAWYELYEADTLEEFSKLETIELNALKKYYSHGQLSNIIKHKKTALLHITGVQNQKSCISSIITVKGNIRDVQFWRSVAPGHEQDLSRVFITMVDVTDRIKAENELKEYKDHLEEVVEERTFELKGSLKREQKLHQTEQKLRRELETNIKQQTEVIRRLIHDFKTPLLPMMGTSQMMLDHVQDEEIKRMALNINRGTQKLNNSVNDFIDVMRDEIGILQLEKRETDLAELLAEVGEFFIYEAGRNNQTLKLQLKKSLPTIWADPERLRQVVMNLLENAIRYTPSGGTIILKATQKGLSLVVEVIDSGHGIKDKDLPHLFEPYYSAEKGGRRVAGLGLGLPLSKILIELHGGKIWAKNQPGSGANIGFSIPIKTKLD